MKKQTGRVCRVSGVGCRMVAALAAGMMLAGTAYAWSPALMAEGGDTNYIWFAGPTEAYGVHVYTNTSGGTFTPQGSLDVEYLVVAGGGGGGGYHGGGGGAGGVLTNSPSSLLTISSFQTITVGGGGADGATQGEEGWQGGPSSIGALRVATGGGGGRGYNNNGRENGGSGGGGGGHANSPSPGTGISAPTRQGYDGGWGNQVSAQTAGGGGGGAALAGSDNTASTGGNGGTGVTNSITGTAKPYAGGGGGQGDVTGGTGGSGVGGNGYSGSGGNVSGGNGLNGTGGGGGGRAGQNSSGAGKGGSGIVVIRYLIPFTEAPVIQNQPVTDVTTNSATFKGLLVDTNTSAATVGVLWGPQNAGETWSGWANTNWFDGNGWTNNTSFSTNITGLAPDITYYYTYAATNGSSNAVAAGVKSFITGAVTVNATGPGAQYKVPPMDTGEYTIYRPATATNEEVTVFYTLTGSATNGVHYDTLPLSATISQGATSTVFTLTPTYVGFGGDAVLTLTTGTSNTYPVGVSPNNQATVTISAPALPSSFLVVTNGTPGVTSTEPYGTWATAATDIQTAVNFAGAVSATHPTFNTVTVSNGTYNITAQILITNAITVRSFGNGVYGGLTNAPYTVIDAGDGSIRGVLITNALASLDGFTIQRGEQPSKNTLMDYSGAGVWLYGGVLQNCIVQDNNRLAPSRNYNFTQGGGVYLTGGGTVSNCVMRRNIGYGPSAWGGGVYMNSGLLTHCQMYNNTNYANGSASGAGVYMTGGTTRNCLMYGNSSITGGGAYVGGGALESSTIVTNTASTDGGGVYLAGGTVNNSIVYFNTVGGVHSNLNTTAGLAYSCSINPGTTADNNITADPLFEGLAGGNYRLTTSSDCIDAGNDAAVTWATDLDGDDRIQNDHVDMGAYETYIPPPATVILLR